MSTEQQEAKAKARPKRKDAAGGGRTRTRTTVLQDIETLKGQIDTLAAKSDLKIELLGSAAEKSHIKGLLYGTANFTGIVSGDFWIVINGYIFKMFERKTYADYIASLMDGRWEMQKVKSTMMPVEASSYYYLFEDDAFLDDDDGEWASERKTILGGQCGAIIIGGNGLLQTTSQEMTALYLLTMVKKAYNISDTQLQKLKRYPIVPKNFDPAKADKSFIASYCPAALDASATRRCTCGGIKRKADANDDDDETVEDEVKKAMDKLEDKFSSAKRAKTGSANSADDLYRTALKGISGLGQKVPFIMAAYPSLGQLCAMINDVSKTPVEIMAQLAEISLVSSKMDTGGSMSSSSSASGTAKRKTSSELGYTYGAKIYSMFRINADNEPPPPGKPKKARAKAKAKSKTKASK
jgi:hypothetical protein